MKQSIQIVVLGGLLFSQTVFSQEYPVFQEENGFLMIEVESAARVDDWVAGSSIADSKGSGYYQWGGSNHFNVNSAGNGTLTYHFNISTPGNYEFRWRSYIGIGDDFREHNDSWVRFPSGVNINGEHPLSGWTKGYMNKLEDWSWTTYTVDNAAEKLRQYFSAGEHIIEISGRSEGHVIDRFALFKYEDMDWNRNVFDSAAQSESIGGDTTGGDTTGGDTTGGDTTSGDTTSGDTTSGDTTGGDTTSGDTTSGDTTSGDTTSGDTTSGDTTSGDTTSGDSSTLPSWTTAVSPLATNECTDNSVAIELQKSLYTDNGSVISADSLRIDGNQRTAFLHFDLSYLPVPLSDAQLLFHIGEDGGSGTINISTGSHHDWSESDSTIDTMPDPMLLVDSYLGQWESDTTVSLPLDPLVLGNGPLTLIMSMQSDADDISIDIADSDLSPRLLFTGAELSFCGAYEQLQPTPESGEQTVQETTDSETQDNADTPTTNQANAGSEDGGSGSSSWFLLSGLLAMSVLRRRLKRAEAIRTR